jgi:hypothetical protein
MRRGAYLQIDKINFDKLGGTHKESNGNLTFGSDATAPLSEFTSRNLFSSLVSIILSGSRISAGRSSLFHGRPKRVILLCAGGNL